MAVAYLGLGSNLGDRIEYLRASVNRLDAGEGIKVLDVSPVYESQAHVLPDQDPAPDFLNAVAKIESVPSPLLLLDRCLAVEVELGRKRGEDQWLPRTIDIDILLIGDMSYSDPRLTLPHPRLHERRFVLRPLCDLDEDVWIPDPYRTTAGRLLAACEDQSRLSMVEDDLTPVRTGATTTRIS
jgi:2-amino-4-hydroxy-6-hydroxymethyldihydropteridine diphosphokinase